MPKITALDNIIDSGQMRISHRILTTDIQWPDGEPPFPVGQMVRVPLPPTAADETILPLPASATFLQAEQNISVMDTFRDYIASDINTTGLDIVCIGDSIFEGLYSGVNYYSDSWAYKLREKLQAKFNPFGVGGLGYMPFSAGFYETTRAVWNTRFPDAIPESLIIWDSTGGLIHSWQADWAYGMWTRETAARGVYMEGVTDAKMKWTFANKTSGIQLIVMKYPDPYDVLAWVDINSTDAFVDYEAGDIVSAVQTIPHTVEPEASYEYATYGGYSYGNHLEQVELPVATDNVTVQIGNNATNNNHLVASGIVHYNGDYAQGIRLHNFATSGNWAFPESERLQQNITKWCTQAGGATNARLFICNLITNDYIYQENQIAYNVWHAENPDAQPEDEGYLYNPCLTLPIDSTYYALVMDQVIAANTDPVLLWVIPPKPYFGGTTETYTYQEYVDMIYTLASTRPEVAILDMWAAVGKVERTALTNGWGDIDLTHFTAIWQEVIASTIAQMIAYKWTDVTAITSDYHITQDSSMQIDAASISVPLAWKTALPAIFREMRAVLIQEKYSDGTNTTGWINKFWGISDGYSESWNGNQHGYVVNAKNALKMANLEYLGTKTGSIVYQPDTIKVGTNATHYDMDLVNTATDAFEFGVCVTQGDEDTAVHPNWADKPAPQFFCHNARDKDGTVSTEPIPLAIGGSAVNAVFGEGLIRVGITWARTSSDSNDVTDYSQGLGLTALEIPDIRCVLYRYAHPEVLEAVTFRTPLTVVTDIVEGLHVESSSAGQVVLNTAVSTHGLTLLLNDGTGKRYHTTTTGTSSATLTLSNTSVIVPVNTPVTYGDANKLTTIIQRMLLDCGYQQGDSEAALYINTPSVPMIAGAADDLILPPLVYKDTDKVYPIDALESMRQSGYIPPNYYIRADNDGQIIASSVAQLPALDSGIIEISAIPSNPGIEYDRNDLNIKTRVVARGIVRQVTDYTQVAGVTIADVSEANGGLPATPAFTLEGQALRSGGDHIEGNYEYVLTDLFQRYQAPSTDGMDLRPWGWYYANSNPANGIANVVSLVNQWKNIYLAEITLAESIEINSIEMWFPNPWLSDPVDWGLGYHTTDIYHYGPRMSYVLDKRAHYDPQTISIEYYDSDQESWMPLINNLVCPISMDSNEYVKRVESADFSTRESVISDKLRIFCVDPFFAEHGQTYHAIIGVFMSQFKVWGSTEIRGVAELGNAANYNSELSAEPWPTIKKRVRTRTHILEEAVPWITDSTKANWLALEWLKQMVQDMAPRKLSIIRPDVQLWDTVTVSTPGGDAIDYLVTATDHGANGVTGISAVSYNTPYFDED